MKKYLIALLCLVTNVVLAQNFQILPKNHIAKSAFYKHFTHHSMVLQPSANMQELMAALQKENFKIENSGTMLAGGGKNENLLVRRDGKDKDFYKVIETFSKTLAYTEPILVENGTQWIENADLYLKIRPNFSIKDFFAYYISNKIISILYTSDWNTCLLRIENLAYYQQIRTAISIAKEDFILCSTNKVLATQLNSITPPTDQFFLPWFVSHKPLHQHILPSFVSHKPLHQHIKCA